MPTDVFLNRIVLMRLPAGSRPQGVSAVSNRPCASNFSQTAFVEYSVDHAFLFSIHTPSQCARLSRQVGFPRYGERPRSALCWRR